MDSNIFRRFLFLALLCSVSTCYANPDTQRESSNQAQNAQSRSQLIADSIHEVRVSIPRNLEELVFATDWSDLQGKIKNEDIAKLEKLEEKLTQTSLVALKAESVNALSMQCDFIQLKVAVSGILKALRDLQTCGIEKCVIESLRKPRNLLYTWVTTLRDTLRVCEKP